MTDQAWQRHFPYGTWPGTVDDIDGSTKFIDISSSDLEDLRSDEKGEESRRGEIGQRKQS